MGPQEINSREIRLHFTFSAFEKTRIHFKSDVFAAVVVVDAKVPHFLRNSRHFATPPPVSTRNDVCGTSAEIPYWWRVTCQICVVLLIGWSKCSTCQKHHPDLGSNASSVWNFCARSSDFISRKKKQLWRRDATMLGVFSGYLNSLLNCILWNDNLQN